MESKPLPSGPDVNRLTVPDDLQQQLHEANQRFHEAKRNIEEAMKDTEYDHGQHVEKRMEEMRAIEREVEELNGKVKEILSRKV
jgi:polyhydroxyalkanoate synthesis regulator phasin